jgi:LTXXQ motif family protein
MTFTFRAAVSVLALAVGGLGAAPVALSQTAPPPAAQVDQDHRAHHPDAKSQDQGQSSKPPSMGMDGMNGKIGHGGMAMHGDDMKQMMSMMRDMMTMMSALSGMMASHVEGRIAALKTELKITEAQAPQWQRFADALRGAAKSMEAMQGQMMKADAPAPLSARLARQEEMLSAHLASVKALKAAFDPLYASFGDEQKKVADGIRIGPMGMM